MHSNSQPGSSPPPHLSTCFEPGQAEVNKPGPVAEGEEDPPLDAYPSYISRESHRDIYGAPAPQLISKYERNTPPETIDGKPGALALELTSSVQMTGFSSHYKQCSVTSIWLPHKCSSIY